MQTYVVEPKPNSPNFTIEVINGKIIKLLTMNALSKYVGLKSHTLRQWERKGLLPKPQIVKKFISGLAGECDRRLYTMEQALLLKQWVERVRPNHGVKIKESMIEILHDKWIEVTNQFLDSYGTSKN